MKTFEELGVSEEIRRAISELGFEHPMPVQEEVIPYLLGEGNDVIALAQTGTGKTAAFGIPLLQKLDPNNRETQALILSPTRELCLQISDDIKDFAKFIKSRGHKVEIDRKDPKIYYPVTYGLDYDFVNNELMPHSVFNRILEKEGIFVENGHLMVRQMQPTATGIPIEIYAFTKITEWGAFEKIQSAFFEHLFTVAKDFDLKIFQLSPEDYRAAAALHY